MSDPPLVFRLGAKAPPLVREVLEARGWREHDDDADGDRWDLFWRPGRFTMAEYAMASMHKRVNHLPKTTGITKKDALLRNLRRMRKLHGSVLNFPQTPSSCPPSTPAKCVPWMGWPPRTGRSGS
jgi:tubulin polyglutamylase TTLL2